MKLRLIRYRYVLGLAVLLVLLNSTIAIVQYTHFPVATRVQFLWFIASLSDSVAAAVMFLEMRHSRHRGNRLVEFYAMAWLAIAAESWLGLIASLSPPTAAGPIHYSLWNACFIWSGRWTKSYAVLLVSLFQAGVINGYKIRPIRVKKDS